MPKKSGKKQTKRANTSEDGAAPPRTGGTTKPEQHQLGYPMLVFTRESVRELDRAAVEEYGVPGVVLMENAASAIFEVCIDVLRNEGESMLVAVCCGGGNNGGDGLALARQLHNSGARVGVLLCADPEGFEGDALTNLRIVQRMRIPIVTLDPESPTTTLKTFVRTIGHPDLIVDALLGTGLDRPLRYPLTEVVDWINETADDRALVVSVDIPTGMDCDTGLPLIAPDDDEDEALRRSVVMADVTVTLAGFKAGFFTPEAHVYTGDLIVGDIGAPRELIERLGRPIPLQ